MIRFFSLVFIWMMGTVPAVASCDESRLVEIIQWCAKLDNISSYASGDAEARAVYGAIRFGRPFEGAQGTAAAISALERCHRNNPEELSEIATWRSCDETRFNRAITLALPAR